MALFGIPTRLAFGLEHADAYARAQGLAPDMDDPAWNDTLGAAFERTMRMYPICPDCGRHADDHDDGECPGAGR